MPLRKIGSWTFGRAVAKVYRDTEYDEYQVKLYVGGGPKVIGSYFTDSRDDAMRTAQSMARQANYADIADRVSMSNAVNQE